MDTDGTRAIIPPNVPLMAKTPRAAEIFDIPRGQLLKLRKRYPDFPAVKVGRDVYFDVPRCYAWFGQFLGGDIETDKNAARCARPNGDKLKGGYKPQTHYTTEQEVTQLSTII